MAVRLALRAPRWQECTGSDGWQCDGPCLVPCLGSRHKPGTRRSSLAVQHGWWCAAERIAARGAAHAKAGAQSPRGQRTAALFGCRLGYGTNREGSRRPAAGCASCAHRHARAGAWGRALPGGRGALARGDSGGAGAWRVVFSLNNKHGKGVRTVGRPGYASAAAAMVAALFFFPSRSSLARLGRERRAFPSRTQLRRSCSSAVAHCSCPHHWC